MKKTTTFDLNTDQATKLNSKLPRGYKLISMQDNLKRINQLKKKPKITYVPLDSQQTPTMRRPKQTISYYQGDQQPQKQKQIQQYQPDKNKIKKQFIQKQSNNSKIKQSQQLYLPPSTFNKNPLSPKEIIQQFQNHRKFYIISKYQHDFPDKSTYHSLINKCQSTSFTLNDLFTHMRDLFMNIYGSYQKTSQIYNDAAQLQGDLIAMINIQRAKLKQPKLDKLKQPKQPLYYKQQPSQSASQKLQNQLLKKKSLPVKPDTKNITIKDKRILGQTIKKLPNQCLPQICRIVFETIETRQQYVIDIDMLPLKKVKQLQIYVNSCITRFGDIQSGNQLRNELQSTQQSFIIQNDYD